MISRLALPDNLANIVCKEVCKQNCVLVYAVTVWQHVLTLDAQILGHPVDRCILCLFTVYIV